MSRRTIREIEGVLTNVHSGQDSGWVVKLRLVEGEDCVGVALHFGGKAEPTHFCDLSFDDLGHLLGTPK